VGRGAAMSGMGQTGQSRSDPFARGVGEHCGQVDYVGGMVDRGRLAGRDFVAAEGFADDVDAGRERRLAGDAGLPARLGATPLPGAVRRGCREGRRWALTAGRASRGQAFVPRWGSK